ncbi:MAG TPA: hypothetical protein VGX00_00240 [Thermoplasmata archaeon]|nr:hypothetical protein [Thermoplasmata archaeon]
MPAAVLVRGGGRLFLVRSGAGEVEPVGVDPGRGAPDSNRADPLPFRATVLGRTGTAELRAGDPELLEVLGQAGISTTIASLAEFRAAREALPWPKFRAEREAVLTLAQQRFTALLASPQETLVALAREEERVERVLSRERGAAEHWIAPEVGTLAEYALHWEDFRSALAAHHESLLGRLEREAERTVPNLSALLGAKVAARLVAAAGGTGPLGRMSASRLQLLGARRRAGGGRGPKYGILARAVLEPEIPVAARGAFARSLAALAVIAARADAHTHAPLAPFLQARRTRRLKDLAGRSGR